MKTLKEINESYTTYLGDRSGALATSIKCLQQQGCSDEATLDRIRLNVVEIFTKMYAISSKEATDVEMLQQKYDGFFEKITTPWVINKEKAESFQKDHEVLIEEIKLEVIEELKREFHQRLA